MPGAGGGVVSARQKVPPCDGRERQKARAFEAVLDRAYIRHQQRHDAKRRRFWQRRMVHVKPAWRHVFEARSWIEACKGAGFLRGSTSLLFRRSPP